MQIIIGTGLAAGPRRRGEPSTRPGPALLRPPALRGDGRVGAELAVDPGDWSGAARLIFAWLRNGAPIARADGPTYVPAASDDGAAVGCEVTALGEAAPSLIPPQATARTPPITIAFPPPRPVGAIPDIAYTQSTGPINVDISPFFSGASLAFSVTGDGVSIDPVTGVVRLDLAALLTGGAVRVTATNSGGRADLDFRLRLAAPPVMIAEPALAGSGRVGEALSVDPGVWAGDPAPEVALQWLGDGTPVAGAVEVRFTPGAAEDGAAVACRVTATNAAGTVVVETPAIPVTQAPPETVGALADQALALGGAAAQAPTAAAFAGTALRFSVEGAGAEMDAETGVVTLPAATARDAEAVTVTAANSGGAATARFAVTVLPAPAALGAPPAAVFALAAGAGTIATAEFFAGAALAYALEAAPAGVAIDAGSGVATVPTGAALDGEIVVRASNAVGVAVQRIAVTVRSTLGAPVALGAPPPVVFSQGPGARTVSAQAFFTGEALVYALGAAPAGVSVNPGSGLVTVSTAAPLAGEIEVQARNAAGVATQRFALAVRATTSVFDAAAALADVRFVFPTVAPGWTANAGGFARLTCGATDGDRAHGDWAHARGDGVYRALARWTAGAATVKQSRPFGLVGRMSKSGDDFRGVRIDAVLQATGAQILQIRDYTGVGVGATTLAGVPVAWAWNAWWWLEAEFGGATVRARLYPEAAAAPDWQVKATTATLAPGAFGPSSHMVVTGQTPVVDIRRLEFHPLAQAVTAAPAAPLDGDWSLDQIMVQQ